MFWKLWSSYAAYYFGRVNLSIVMPVLLVTFDDLSLYSIGWVASGFLGAYAIGQFVHGQLSEKYNPVMYLTIGLIGSAVINLALGFSAGFFFVLLIGEIIDGGFQSMGWSSTVRAHAETSKDPEKTSTMLGTAYQVGNSVAWLVAAFAVGQFGWEAGFFVAAIVMFARAGANLATMPKIVPKPRPQNERTKLMFTRPVFFSGLSLMLLNMMRYGVIIWMPTYLYTEYGLPIEKVGLTVFMIPLAGVAGTLLYNKLRWKKDISTIVYVLALSLVFLGFTMVDDIVLFTVLLVLSGFLLYGPHVFLVTTIPCRLLGEKAVASSAGFIDGFGYIGSVLVGILVPFMVDKSGGNWESTFYLWAGLTVVIAVLVLSVYLKNTRN